MLLICNLAWLVGHSVSQGDLKPMIQFSSLSLRVPSPVFIFQYLGL